MKTLVMLMLVTIVSCQVAAADPVRTITSVQGVLTASAAREADRVARSMVPKPGHAKASRQQPSSKGWIARHPELFGALVGFGAGCVLGASQVGGSEDNFFNALDEFACPVVGGIGAGAGALVGALFK